VSRTPKRQKSPGFEYWSKKASSTGTCGPKPGHAVKKVAARVERRRTKQRLVKDEP